MARRSRANRVLLVALMLMAMVTAAPISTGSSNALSSKVTLTTRSITSSTQAATSARIVTSSTSARPSRAGSRSSTADRSASQSTTQPSRGASTSIESKPSSLRSSTIIGGDGVTPSTARTAIPAKPAAASSIQTTSPSPTNKAASPQIIKTAARSTHTRASSTRTRSAKSTVTRVHSTRTHTHTHTSVSHALHTPSGAKIIAHPIPGSTWERVRKILLIPLSIMTVLTFLVGVGLYIAATWGSGEGWFGKDLDSGEKLGAVPGDIKVLVEEKKKQIEMDEGTEEKKEETGRRNSDGSFQFRVPSLDDTPAKQS